MNQDDLKRLITQYEQWQSTGIKNFNDDDVIKYLRKLLIMDIELSEVMDLLDSYRG